MVHVPAETVLHDVRTNLSAGLGAVSLVSEDLLRYGASLGRLDPEALLDLVARIASMEGVRIIQGDHVNVASVARYSDDQLERLYRLLACGAGPRAMVWVNVGVESASGLLLQSAGCEAKMLPHGPGRWAALCREQVLRLCRAGFSRS
jgi:radical SAM superfamily enzyme YgiQ (UPF0313 family)